MASPAAVVPLVVAVVVRRDRPAPSAALELAPPSTGARPGGTAADAATGDA
ncbi:hypothetical protein [Streptomyces olivaceoviridis]|uniref:hypothetical protein n=1 Tax=Streptomyces olivaceoviridis TaxID=1921 RepID=UPI0036F4DFA7